MLEGMALFKFLMVIMEKYGIHVAFAVLVFGYYAKAKVDGMRLEELNREKERARNEDAKRKEHIELVEELKETRKDHQKFIETHFSQERVGHSKFIAVLTDMSSAIHALIEKIKSHREEDRDRAGKMFAKLEHIHRAAIRNNIHDA